MNVPCLLSSQMFDSLDVLLLVLAYFHPLQYCLPHLRKVQGNIINDSSLVAKIGQRSAVPYIATKGAIDAMTRGMAVDEAVYGVRVNV